MKNNNNVDECWCPFSPSHTNLWDLQSKLVNHSFYCFINIIIILPVLRTLKVLKHNIIHVSYSHSHGITTNLSFPIFQKKNLFHCLKFQKLVCLWKIINIRTASFWQVIFAKNGYLLTIHEDGLETWLCNIWIFYRPCYIYNKLIFTSGCWDWPR